jgi:peptidoglycan/LPS O-acetylase OafA/YrhL
MLNIEYQKRILGLDILRSFAIISVMYNHGWIYSIHFADRKKYDVFHFDGVSLFFVLSGFLIGNILLNTIEKKGATLATLKEFWVRRWFRTLPLYYLILLFGTARIFYVSQSIEGYQSIIKYYLFLQNFFYLDQNFFLESWSLAVEEWFYFLVPIILWALIMLLQIKIKQLLPLLICLFIIVCYLIRHFKFEIYSDELLLGKPLSDRFPFTVVCRLDSIMFGVVAAYIKFYFNHVFDRRNALLFIGVIILFSDYIIYNYHIFTGDTLLYYKIYYRNVIHYSIMPLSCALVLPYFNNIKSYSNYLCRFLIFTSVISYSLYLIHLQVISEFKIPQLLDELLISDKRYTHYFCYASYWLLSFVFAALIYKFYESPLTNLRERFSKNS